ncbi:SMP-30/gluconolactonase/LRE family protein [Streptomyces sp. MBT62]|uniref:SMP-30/gluconolactonase/LRE family protein n=1 Tax=Streptomyces sp. MBT62 TaxID=2800410 RepID=UPI00190B8E73|nr:SMP-30/gluconolactonase/LRE family protein [Streptomyces sp. MBT62]MBK3562328.1 SMP-30/gluconolactonase/LRE family protein [Streptomyces sp. MBT62]
MSNVRTYTQLEVAVRSETSDVGEGPVFDPRTGHLLWVDIYGRKVFEDELSTGRQTVHDVGTMVGAVAPREAHDGFAVAVADGFGYVTDEGLTLIDPVLPEPNLRMNDGKVDSRGRFWAGSNDMEFAPGQGRLHRWDGDGPSVVVADGLVLPNGLGWNVEDTVMYLADSYANLLYRADFDAEPGELGRLEVLTKTEGVGVPDGLAVDVEGCFWVAMHGGREVRRYDPTGRVVGLVPVPVLQPTSCAFGADGRLYITSARNGLPAEELTRSPLSGSVFVVETGTAGVPVRPFRA